MNHQVTTERFHALDATRAFALMLGVVFHIAWGFVPRNAGTPFTDVSSSVGFAYFFYASHIFRMQVFFLIAGFFGRMMLHRRGRLGFAKSRMVRIGIPLILGWAILMPLIILTWLWGANQSGQNLVAIPWSVMIQALPLLLVPRSMGGLFTVGHLWFLYYLLWLYVATLVIQGLFARMVTHDSFGGRRVDQTVALCVRSRWSLVPLALTTGLVMWWMIGWNGVDTPSKQLKLAFPVFLLYGLFFGFGWLLHRQTHLLREFAKHWKFNLILGATASVVLFAAFDRPQGPYPIVSPFQIGNWPDFMTKMQSVETDPDVDDDLALLWERVPAGSRERILQLTGQPPIDLKIGICKTLNKLLVYPELFEPAERDAAGNPIPLPAGLLDPETTPGIVLSNRIRLNQLFPENLGGDPKLKSWYWPTKLAYSIGYGLAMWCLVFATLGFFQAHCTHHSRTWRYVADSSYWVYLAHLPLVTWMHVWIFPLNWPGLVKFGLLNVVGFGVLFLSYHFLVRSTYVGSLLNGRRHRLAFRLWPIPNEPCGESTTLEQASSDEEAIHP